MGWWIAVAFVCWFLLVAVTLCIVTAGDRKPFETPWQREQRFWREMHE